MSHVTHVNQPCREYERVLSHTDDSHHIIGRELDVAPVQPLNGMSDVAHVNHVCHELYNSCRITRQKLDFAPVQPLMRHVTRIHVTSHVYTSRHTYTRHVTRIHEPFHTCERVMSHLCVHESCRTYECVAPYVCMSYVSRRTFMRVMSLIHIYLLCTTAHRHGKKKDTQTRI